MLLLLFQNLLDTGEQAITTASPISSTVLYTPIVLSDDALVTSPPISSTVLYVPTLSVTIFLPVISSTTIYTPIVLHEGVFLNPDLEFDFVISRAINLTLDLS